MWAYQGGNMSTIETAQKLLADITTANNEIGLINTRIAEKEALIAKLLSAVKVSTVEELEQLLEDTRLKLETTVTAAKAEYDKMVPFIEEAKACLNS